MPPDPPPIVNARTENFAYEESTVRILEYQQPNLPPWGAGPQTLRALQNGETPRQLEWSSEENIGRITDQTAFVASLVGAEIMEIALQTGIPNTPADGRLTSLPSFSGVLTGAEVMELIATGRGNTVGTTENANLIPLDGRLTSLQLFAIALAGTEVMELVMPNNAATGQNYQITTALLAAFFSAFPFLNALKVTNGASSGSPFPVPNSTTRVLVDVPASAAYLQFPLAASMIAPFPVLIKDFAGTAFANNITITFSGGEECDGQSNLVIDNNYGWVTINPDPGGGGWYQS